MPESELAKEMKDAIKKADKLVEDVRKDTWDLLRVLKQLRARIGAKEGKDETETK